MRLLVLPIAVCAAAACDGGGAEFGRESTGLRAVAWETCVSKGFGGETPYYAPDLIEPHEDQIAFFWRPEHSNFDGAPILCKTSGDGLTLLEVQVSGSSLE